jgi:hypothetical protein
MNTIHIIFYIIVYTLIFMFAIGNSTVKIMHMCKPVWTVTSLFTAACKIRVKNIK